MGDIISFYIKGRKEGYFDVRLESVLNEDRSTREVFLKGYQLGRMIRKKEEVNESEDERNLYNQKRQAYIMAIGFKTSNEGYPADASALRGDDKNTFELGYNAGKLCNAIEHEGMLELDNYQKQMRLVRNE